VLNPGDVRALNECQLTEQEKVEERRVRAKRGITVGATEEDEEEDLADIRVVAKPAEVREGACRPSWIWFQSIGHDNMNDPLMRAGKSHKYIFLFIALMYDICSTACQMGKSEGKG
jgi:hypothetical protein